MPESTNSPDPQIGDRLKSTLWYHIGKIVDEETINLGANATPQYIGSLTELVWAQIESVATDLEAFARHAGRSTIKTDDVLLLTRRNEGLETIMKNKLEEIKRENERKAKEKNS